MTVGALTHAAFLIAIICCILCGANGLLYQKNSPESEVCGVIELSGTNYQQKREGRYVLLDTSAEHDCTEDRPAYKQTQPGDDNYVFYLKRIGNWLVGPKLCVDNAGLYVSDRARQPNLVTSWWKEHRKVGGWTSNSRLRVECSTCANNTYGENCTTPCGNCLGGSCLRNNGFCRDGCAVGYRGSKCVEECSPDKYGPLCSKVCRCLNDRSCNNVDGSCPDGECEQGWSGSACEIHDCHVLYQLVWNISHVVSSQCKHVVTHRDISLAECQERVCDLQANIINYNNERGICSARKCPDDDLKLSTGHGAWDIYRREDMYDDPTTITTTSMSNTPTTSTSSALKSTNIDQRRIGGSTNLPGVNSKDIGPPHKSATQMENMNTSNTVVPCYYMMFVFMLVVLTSIAL